MVAKVFSEHLDSPPPAYDTKTEHMTTNSYFRYLQSCLSYVAETLAPEESVLSVEQGQTAYGRQTFVYYKVRVGTFKNMTGNNPIDLRSAVFAVNVDTPNPARPVDESEWRPLSE